MAETHLEVYRRFDGALSTRPWRFWAIWVAGVRTALKPKLALLVLYAPLVIGTVIFSFVVYGSFAAKEMLEEARSEHPQDLKGMLAQRAALSIAEQGMQLLEVRNQIAQFDLALAMFSLLATAWYGSGLLCEDRRFGAHQLYFSRPITRLDYFLGKLLVVAFFTACTMVVPGLVICLVAAFSSPEWSFLKEQGDVIWRTIAAASVWVALTGSTVLAVSSLASRKIFALIGCFALVMILSAFGGLLGDLHDPRFHVLSPLVAYQRVASWILDAGAMNAPQGTKISDAWAAIGTLTALSLAVVALRLRRLEVVA